MAVVVGCRCQRALVGGGVGNFNDNILWSTTSGGVNNTTAPGSSGVATFDAGGVGNVIITTNPNVGGINIGAGYTGTLTQNTGVALTVGASNYTQAGGAFTGGNSAITVNGAFTLSGGVFTSTSGNFTVGHSSGVNATFFTVTAGTLDLAGQNLTVTSALTVANGGAL